MKCVLKKGTRGYTPRPQKDVSRTCAARRMHVCRNVRQVVKCNPAPLPPSPLSTCQRTQAAWGPRRQGRLSKSALLAAGFCELVSSLTTQLKACACPLHLQQPQVHVEQIILEPSEASSS